MGLSTQKTLELPGSSETLNQDEEKASGQLYHTVLSTLLTFLKGEAEN